MGLDRENFRSGKHVVHTLTAHIVLVAKYLKKVMSCAVRDVIEKAIRDTCGRLGIELLEFNTDTDHAHVLISYPPKYSISEIVRAFKTNSSRKVRIECADEIREQLPKTRGNPNLIKYGQLHSSPPSRKGFPGVD